MAIIDIMAMGDDDVEPVLEVGSIVTPLDPFARPVAFPKNTLYIKFINSTYEYTFGVVISLSPLVVVSEDGGMRWEASIDAAKLKPIGRVKQEVLDRLMTRLAR